LSAEGEWTMPLVPIGACPRHPQHRQRTSLRQRNDGA
jgi:hypothetical protein